MSTEESSTTDASRGPYTFRPATTTVDPIAEILTSVGPKRTFYGWNLQCWEAWCPGPGPQPILETKPKAIQCPTCHYWMTVVPLFETEVEEEKL